MLDGSGKAVLIVDDDAGAIQILAHILLDSGFDVHTAMNGLEALDHLNAFEAPDLILLDLMMPVMDGFEFLHALRREEAWSRIPVIVVSSDFAALPRDAPIQGRISKLSNLDRLLVEINRVLTAEAKAAIP